MKRFLSSVGVASLFRKNNGELQLIARANTLTDSTLSITSTSEDVRAGAGAKLLGRFNHDGAVAVTLTDAMFDINYIALQVGTELQVGGLAMYTEQIVTDKDGYVILSQTPQYIGEACGLNRILVWYREAGCDAAGEYYTVELSRSEADSRRVLLAKAKQEYCISYFTQDVSARSLLIGANFVPAELVLVLTAKLFVGDANNPETGKPVGEITVKIPRFNLDGAWDITMQMGAAATMELTGTALATSADSCDGAGVYAEIIEVINGVCWYDDLIALRTEYDNGIILGELSLGTALDVYGVYRKAVPSYIDPSLLNFDTGTTGAVIDPVTGVFTTLPSAAGEITITVIPQSCGGSLVSRVITVSDASEYPICVSTPLGEVEALELDEGFDENGVFEITLISEITSAHKQTVYFPPGTPAILGIQQYDESRNLWDWIHGSAAWSLSSFTVSTAYLEIDGKEIQYTAYVNALPLIGTRHLRFYIILPADDDGT